MLLNSIKLMLVILAIVTASTASTMSIREQLQTAALQCAEQEKQLLIEIQRLQQNAVQIDELLESLDEGNIIDPSLIPKPIIITVTTSITDNIIKDKLKMAVYEGNIQMVDSLLNHPQINASSINNSSLLTMETKSQRNHLNIINRLLQDARFSPNSCQQALEHAVSKSNLLVVRRLLRDPRVDPSLNANYCFMIAINKCDYEMVSQLLNDPRIDPSDDDNKAIRTICEMDYCFDDKYEPLQLQIIQLLLQDPRVDPSVMDNYALKKIVSIYIQRLNEFGTRYGGFIYNKINVVGTEIILALLEDPRVDPSFDNHFL
jgi:hypothetical protein